MFPHPLNIFWSHSFCVKENRLHLRFVGIPQTASFDRGLFRQSFAQLLRDMFGTVEVQSSEGDKIMADVNDCKVEIDLTEKVSAVH